VPATRPTRGTTRLVTSRSGSTSMLAPEITDFDGSG
jgi:hypothetical protein